MNDAISLRDEFHSIVREISIFRDERNNESDRLYNRDIPLILLYPSCPLLLSLRTKRIDVHHYERNLYTQRALRSALSLPSPLFIHKNRHTHTHTHTHKTRATRCIDAALPHLALAFGQPLTVYPRISIYARPSVYRRRFVSSKKEREHIYIYTSIYRAKYMAWKFVREFRGIFQALPYAREDERPAFILRRL